MMELLKKGLKLKGKQRAQYLQALMAEFNFDYDMALFV